MNLGKLVRGVSQYGVEVSLIAERLASTNPGEVVGYAELTTLAGVDVLLHRNVLNAARKQLQREKHVVFKADFGQGLRRLTNEEIAATGIGRVKAIGRSARRGIKTLSCAQYDGLSSTGKTRHTVGLSLLNMIQHASAEKSINAVTSGAIDIRVLPLEQTLRSLMGK
jgi:hypothetical protein